MRRQGGELVVCRDEREPRHVGDLRRHPLAELGMGVQPRPHRATAEGELVEPGQRQLDALDVGGELGDVPENSWPNVRGTASMRWVRPILVMPANATSLACQRVAQGGHGREEALDHLLGGRDVHRGRKSVVRRLRHVDVVVRVDRVLGADDPAGQLDRPVGDHLVGVHVGLGAAPRLPDSQRELSVERALGDLVGGLDDEVGAPVVELAEVSVDGGRGALQDPERPDEGLGHRLGADVEVVQGALGLRAPVVVSGDFDLPHAVALDACRRCGGHGASLGPVPQAGSPTGPAPWPEWGAPDASSRGVCRRLSCPPCCGLSYRRAA